MKEFILKYIGRTDLLLHALGIYFIATFLAKAFIWCGMGEVLAKVLAIVIAIAVGLWKEFIHDKKKGKGKFEVADLIADGFGIVLSILVMFF
jgi:p-aminobenzoyl-glutamate transporter AbgT